MYKEYTVVDERRLDRMEEKLDKVVDALERLVRLEERHDNAVSRIDRVECRQDTHARRLTDVEQEMRARGAVGGRVERFVWLVLAAVVGAVSYLWRA